MSFALNKVLDDDRGEKTVLTPEQEVSLIDFAQNDPVYQKYADELIILLGTGLRISEFCGLTTNATLSAAFMSRELEIISGTAKVAVINISTCCKLSGMISITVGISFNS